MKTNEMIAWALQAEAMHESSWLKTSPNNGYHTVTKDDAVDITMPKGAAVYEKRIIESWLHDSWTEVQTLYKDAFGFSNQELEEYFESEKQKYIASQLPFPEAAKRKKEDDILQRMIERRNKVSTAIIDMKKMCGGSFTDSEADTLMGYAATHAKVQALIDQFLALRQAVEEEGGME